MTVGGYARCLTYSVGNLTSRGDVRTLIALARGLCAVRYPKSLTGNCNARGQRRFPASLKYEHQSKGSKGEVLFMSSLANYTFAFKIGT